MTGLWFKLRNFKAYVDTDWIQIHPLMLIFGKNSSGKSAVIQGLRLINAMAPSFSRYARERKHSFSLKGQDYDYGDFVQAVHGQKIDEKIGFSFKVLRTLKERTSEDKVRTNSFDIHLDFGHTETNPHEAVCKDIIVDCRSLYAGNAIFAVVTKMADLQVEHDESGEGDELYIEHAESIEDFKIQDLKISLAALSQKVLEIRPNRLGTKRLRPVFRDLFKIDRTTLESLCNQTKPLVDSLDVPNFQWEIGDSASTYFIDLERGDIFRSALGEDIDLQQAISEAETRASDEDKESASGLGLLFDIDDVQTEFSDILEEGNGDLPLVVNISSDSVLDDDQNRDLPPEVGPIKLIASIFGMALRTTLSDFGRVTKIPAFRGEPQRSETMSSEFQSNPLSEAIARLSNDKKLLDKVTNDFQILDIELNLKPQSVRFAGETRSSLGLLPKTMDSVSLALTDVGFGVSQVLPILTALHDDKFKPSSRLVGMNFRSRWHRMMLIEEPETHLHPSLQGDLIQLIALDSGALIQEENVVDNEFDKPPKKQGSIWIIETHSENMASRIQKLVGAGRIDCNLTSFLFCENGKNGPVIRKIGIDEDGRLEEDWPNNFIETSLELQNKNNSKF